MKTLVLLLLCLAGLGSVSAGQTVSQSDSLTDRLEGVWVGEGKAFGMPATLQLKFERVLGKKFLRLTLKNEIKTPNGQVQVFEGHAYYLPLAAGKYDARWFDSRGVSFPIKGQEEGDAVIALWGAPDQEQGKSTYRLIKPGELEVVDLVLQKDGTYREFGRFVLRRG